MTMTTQTTPFDRARALARRAGVKTDAKTLAGIMRRLRGVRIPPDTPSRREPMRSRRATAADLVATCQTNSWQGRASARILDHWEPLRAALSAALGVDVPAQRRAISHGYRYMAYESVAAATRFGRRVLVVFGRAECQVGGYDHAEPAEVAARSYALDRWIIDRRELLDLLPRLPAGWRWCADEFGPCIGQVRGRHVHHTWHPTLHDIPHANPGMVQIWIECALAAFERARRHRKHDDIGGTAATATA